MGTDKKHFQGILGKKGIVTDIIYAVLIIIIILIIAAIAYNYIIGKKSQIGFLESLGDVFKSAEEKKFGELKSSVKAILDLKTENEVNDETERIMAEIDVESQKPENINLITKYEELKFELERTKEIALLNIEFEKTYYPKSLDAIKKKYTEFSKNIPKELSELKSISDRKIEEIKKIENCEFDSKFCDPLNTKGYCFWNINIIKKSAKCGSCFEIKSASYYGDSKSCIEDPCKTIKEEQKEWKKNGWYPELNICKDFCEREAEAIDRRCCMYATDVGINYKLIYTTDIGINYKLAEPGMPCGRGEEEVASNYCCFTKK